MYLYTDKNRAMCVWLQTKARQLNRFECDTSLISFMTKRLLQYVLGYYSSPYFHLITRIKRMVTIEIFSLNLTSTTLFSEPSIRKTDQNPITIMTRFPALVVPWSSIAFANIVNAISQLSWADWSYPHCLSMRLWISIVVLIWTWLLWNG